MKEVNIPAQIVMVCAFIVMTSSFWCKKREHILRLQVLSSILFVTQYIMLGAYTGALLNAISIARAYVFSKKNSLTNDEIDRHNKQDIPKKKTGINYNSNWILVAFLAVFIVSSILTWDTYVSSFAFLATVIYTIGMWADKAQYIRISSNIASVFWVLYNYNMGGYVGCFTEMILFTSNSIAIYKNRNKKICT